jgi:hypothetical protein
MTADRDSLAWSDRDSYAGGADLFTSIGAANQNLIESAGQRGMSVLINQTSGGFRFSIQSRAVSSEDEALISGTPTPLPIEGNMTISASIGLNYCPFRGTNLQKLVRSSTKKHFQALAEKHMSIDKCTY